MFYSKKLRKFKNIKHCFFSRKNGFSEGEFKSLNCGLGSGDKKKNILKNINFVSKKIGCKKKILITLSQHHTNKAIYFKDKKSIKQRLPGDAMITKVKKVAIAILTADCVPILFYDPKNNVVGCAHSGWKGALNGIIENTVKKFNKVNSKNKDLIVVVGPCISKNNYEVKNDFYNKFLLKDKKNKIFFKKKSSNYFFDLRGFVNKKLSDLNIKNIENIDVDTYSNSDSFFSYRRSCHKREKNYGRCISVILMT